MTFTSAAEVSGSFRSVLNRDILTVTLYTFYKKSLRSYQKFKANRKLGNSDLFLTNLQ